MVTYTDTTLMPFGKYKGKTMANVPAAYLMFLYKEGVTHPGVKQYINDNLDVLQQEEAKTKKR